MIEQTNSHQGNPNPDNHRQHSHSRSQSFSHPPRRPFPNDFDDHFATTQNPENPFNLLTIDFDAFPNMPDTPQETINLSPSNDDLADIDWTQALFRDSTLPEMDLSVSGPFGGPETLQSEQQVQESEQEQDLFAFTLKDEEENDGPDLRHLSNGNITGDLDRDLGFQTGDEGF